MIKELICTSCPIGCTLRVEYEGESIISLTGNTCKNGYTFGVNEVLHPKRTLTTIVRVDNRSVMLSVKSASELPRERISECMDIINKVTVSAPVRLGDVIISDIGGTGVDIVATKTIE